MQINPEPLTREGTMTSRMCVVCVGIGLVLFDATLGFARKKATPPPATRPSVEAALNRTEGRLVSADVKSMGADADRVLVEIVSDEHAPGELRGRAIDALAASGSAVARAQLLRMVKPTQSEVDLSLVRKALLGLGWLHDARIVVNAGPWLEHDSVNVRSDAAMALALSKSTEATDLLERHNRTEKDLGLKRSIAHLIAINRAQQAPPKPAAKPRITPPPPLEGRDSHRF